MQFHGHEYSAVDSFNRFQGRFCQANDTWFMFAMAYCNSWCFPCYKCCDSATSRYGCKSKTFRWACCVFSSWLGDNVNSGIGLSYRPARLQDCNLLWNTKYWTIYRGPGFLAVVWFGSSPSPPLPLPSATSLSFSVFLFLLSLLKGGGGA